MQICLSMETNLPDQTLKLLKLNVQIQLQFIIRIILRVVSAGWTFHLVKENNTCVHLCLLSRDNHLQLFNANWPLKAVNCVFELHDDTLMILGHVFHYARLHQSESKRSVHCFVGYCMHRTEKLSWERMNTIWCTVLITGNRWFTYHISHYLSFTQSLAKPTSW